MNAKFILLIVLIFGSISIFGDNGEKINLNKKREKFNHQFIMPIQNAHKTPVANYKLAEDTMQKLDSIVNSNDKIEYVYDQNGNSTQAKVYELDNGQWQINLRYEWNYDSIDNVIKFIEYERNTSDIESYNEYFYDLNGRLAQVIQYDGYSEVKIEFTYDDQGNNKTESSYSWRNNQWILSDKYEWNYDDRGNKTQEFYYQWDDELKIKLNYWREDYTYNSKDNLTLTIVYGREKDQWVLLNKYEYSYSEKGNYERLHYYRINNQWTLNSKYEFYFNDNKNIVQQISYKWGNSQWLPEFKYEINYDLSVNAASLIWPNSPLNIMDELNIEKNRLSEIGGKLTDFSKFKWNNTEWVLIKINNYYYSSPNSSDNTDCSLTGILTNGLVAYYPFCGNANDESGNGMNGTVNGATLTTNRFGDENSAYSFSTNQDIAIRNTETQNLFPITISLWYNIDSIKSGENGNLFSKYYPAQWNGYLIHVGNNVIGGDSGIVTYPWYIRDNSNKVLGLYGEKPFYQSNVEVNKWYNYVYTVDETGGKIYVNGELVDTHVWTGESGKCSNVDLWKIGGKYDHWFHGKIDDIGIWNRVLTKDEIQQLYLSCKFNTAINPVTNFIDKGANAVFDVTSNEPNLSYQWQTNPSNVGWLDVPANTSYSGASSNKLTVNNVQLSNHLQTFRVVASSKTCTEISNTAFISLNDTCVNVVDEVNYISVTDTLIIDVNFTGISSTITNTIKVYPNPTKDYITINYGNLASMNGCKLNITNSIGQVVYTSSIIEQIATIKLSSLGKTGLYFVNILDQQNKLIESRKLIMKE